MRSATGSREADLGVFAKLFEDRLEGRLEAETFSRREIGGYDDCSAHWPMWAIHLESAMGVADSSAVAESDESLTAQSGLTLFVVCRISASDMMFWSIWKATR